ncbi:(Fe-S)-binding protein [Maridesulfovibrio bastinii]|uniref:(Fe-S)-binding protein n=1 Tax=Maridesulfovibrio bastinii TaxID=47157 RepID=UPI0003FD1926|nr:(Fe-S)-binding protein [Maridesulfovibrio bastinii]
MPKQIAFAPENAFADKIASGRPFEKQIEDIETYGNHGASDILRNDVLTAHGICNPKKRAANGIIFGCYRPFTTPFLLQDYIRLLDVLGVDYTWLEKEYCCGLPLVTKNLEKGLAQGAKFIQKNRELAAQKGADKLYYCCVGCASAARQASAGSDECHGYILDLILDSIKQRQTKTVSMKLGYFEGCHTYYKAHYPDADLDWPRYRNALGELDGISLVDLSNKLCCKRSADKIIGSALEKGVQGIVCPCNGCYKALKASAQDKLDILTYPEVLLSYLG